MAQKTVYICQECGNSSLRWSGKCGACGAWSSLIEEAVVSASGLNAKPVQTFRLNEIKHQEKQLRLKSGIHEVDQVLGGGIVAGSLLLLAGEPGIGKSTLLLQIAAAIANDKNVLYISGEESLQQIKIRAERLNAQGSNLNLLASNDADEIIATITDIKPDLVIIDSIQTVSTNQISSSPGTVSQITASAHLFQKTAKQAQAAILIVGHVTKEGNIAGPKILEHLVDVVLYLEGEKFGGFKLLRGIKNRFGATNEVGVFEMQTGGLMAVSNPSASFLQERQAASSGSVVFAAIEGTRAVLVEVQALVNSSPFGYPKRTSAGFDVNRLNVLIAVLNQRAGVRLNDKDVYVNVAGGMRLDEPAADLAVAMAIASAAKQKAISDDAVVFGEVGLSGEVRAVSHVDTRIKEAKKMKFKQAFAPAAKTGFINSVRDVNEAITKALVK